MLKLPGEAFSVYHRHIDIACTESLSSQIEQLRVLLNFKILSKRLYTWGASPVTLVQTQTHHQCPNPKLFIRPCMDKAAELISEIMGHITWQVDRASAPDDLMDKTVAANDLS
jgi:hypothetical protein